MTQTDDTAALIERAQNECTCSDNVDEERTAHGSTGTFSRCLTCRLAAALERAQADAARMRGFGIPRSARALAIAACDALGLSHADDFDFDAVERAIEMELDVSNISQGDVAIVVVARAALEPRP